MVSINNFKLIEGHLSPGGPCYQLERTALVSYSLGEGWSMILKHQVIKSNIVVQTINNILNSSKQSRVSYYIVIKISFAIPKLKYMTRKV